MIRAAVAIALAVLTACGGEPARQADAAYVVEVDLAPYIRAFGEETASADEAGEQVAAMGAAAIPALAAALRREPPDVRQKAVEVLATIGTETAVPPILQAAKSDEDADVRADALNALGTLGDERGRAVVEASLADARPPVRGGAVMACAVLCTGQAAIDRLASIALHDENASVALGARMSLTVLEENPERAQAVRAALDRARASLGADARPDARAMAALLASDGDGGPGGVPALVAAIGAASPPLQRQIAWRLGTIGDARSVEPLQQLFGAVDVSVGAYAYDALVKLRDRGVVGAAGALDQYKGRKPAGSLPAPTF